MEGCEDSLDGGLDLIGFWDGSTESLVDSAEGENSPHAFTSSAGGGERGGDFFQELLQAFVVG